MHGTCERCGEREARPQVCPGDGRLHGHGAIHVIAGGTESVCDTCLKAVQQEWDDRRERHGGDQ